MFRSNCHEDRPIDTFANRLDRFGDRIAIATQDGCRLTYRALASRADSFAARLGLGRRLLIIEASNALDPLIAYMGALRAGHPVLLAPSGSGTLNAGIAEHYRPDARFFKDGSDWTLTVNDAVDRDIHPELALLLSTSGSTGSPKLVRLSYSAIEANAKSIVDYLRITAEERAITTLPIHYSYGLSVVASHLQAGATLVLTDLSVIETRFWNLFDREGITSLSGVPHTYDLLDRVGFCGMSLPTLTTLTQAGGRMSPESVRRYGEWARKRGVRFFVMYGQTEATARMSYVPPERCLEAPDAIGMPIPGGRFRLIDETGATIGVPDVTGELVYAGPNVMMGYARAVTDLAKGPELEELQTGDLAVCDERGFYRIVGRTSRFSKLFGLRIDLDEIEATLRREGLQAAVAGDDTLIAIALAGLATPGDLADRLAAEYHLPSSLFHVQCYGQVPILSSGKFDYRAILRLARADRRIRPVGGAISPREGLARAFREAFPGQSIDLESNFVGLGGDSLNYVGLSMDIQKMLGYLPRNWEEMRLGEMQNLAVSPAKHQRWWRLRSIEPEIAVRAFAIVAVVIEHTLSGLAVAGGAEVLIILAGYNLARYQRQRLLEGHGFAVVGSFVRRIILPYYLILVFYLLYKHQIDIPSLLLVSDFFGRFHSFIEPYWFLESLFQLILLTAALFVLRPVRTLAKRDPWRFGLTLLGFSLIVKVGAYLIVHHQALLNRTPDSIYYLFALGWCILYASTPARRAAISAIVILISMLDLFPANTYWFTYTIPSNISHAVWLICAALPILWIPQLRLPVVAQRPIAVVAAASFYIYLTHGMPIYFLSRVLDKPNLALNLAASLFLGVATWKLIQNSTIAGPLWVGVRRWSNGLLIRARARFPG